MGGETELVELREENTKLRSNIEELQSLLQQSETSKLQLKKSYEEALQTLADSEAKRETVDKELRLAHDQISSMWKELESLRKQVEGSSTHEAEPVAIRNTSEQRQQQQGGLDRRVSNSANSLINESFLELQCTLCKEKIKVQDLEAHSKVCASHSKTTSNSISPKSIKRSVSSVTGNRPNVRANSPLKKSSPRNSAAITVAAEEYLVINVTRSSHGATDLTPFKVVTKTNMPMFHHTTTEVYRSQGDFQWLYEALQEACPERIIPPLKPPISLDATMSEFQRFLSRISTHKTLRKQHHFMVFLTGTAEELRSLRAKHRPRRRGDKVQYKPAVGRDTNTGPLVATKDYLTTLEQNITGLVSHLEQAVRRKASAERTGHWFRAISESEPDETYLKMAAADLSRTCEATEGQQTDSDETLFIHNLQSVADFVRAAQDLLTRVEEAVDRFLYWDEEVTIIEAVTSSPVVETPPTENSEDDSGVSDVASSSNHSNSDGHTQSGSHVTSQDSASNISEHEESISTSEKWAQASKHCADSKDYLEMMCRDLAGELAHFDLQKEKELKQVLLEYTAAQLERHEKFRGKWFAMQFLLDAPLLPDKRAIQFSNVSPSSSEATAAHEATEQKSVESH